MTFFKVIDEPSRGSKRVRITSIREIRQLLQAFVRDVRPLRKYPPKRGGTRYKRTRKLARSWRVRVRGGRTEIRGSIISKSQVAPYNKRVQGANQSRRMKRRGWKNVPVGASFIWKTRHQPKISRRILGR